MKGRMEGGRIREEVGRSEERKQGREEGGKEGGRED